MKMSRVFVSLCVLILIIVVCWFRNNKHLTGALVVPLRMQLWKNNGIYSVNVKNGLKEFGVIFSNEKYTNLCFPKVIGESLYFLGENLEDKSYVLLKKSGTKTEVFLKSKQRIYSYSILPGIEVILIMEDEKVPKLYSFSLTEGTYTRIYDGEVDIESKPIIFPDRTVIFVSTNSLPQSSYTKVYNGEIINKSKSIIYPYKTTTFISSKKIMRLKRKDNGSKTEFIANGKYPIAFGEDKIIFYNKRSLIKYDLKTKENILLKKNVVLTETPTLSPDRKALVFYHFISPPMGTETVETLSVMSLKNKKVRQIKDYNDCKASLLIQGVDWIEEESLKLIQ